MATMKLSGESQAMLIKTALIAGALYLLYSKLKSTTGEVIDLVKNIDLNPFDANGFLGLTLPKDTIYTSGYDKSHDAALAKLGLNIKNYTVWYPNPLDPNNRPNGLIQVKWGGNKITYYAPKTASSPLDVFKIF